MDDCAAAFPTAQLVSAMRAVDARSDKPLIGTNIGAGPDLAAVTFQGDIGPQFLRDYGSAYGLKGDAGDAMMSAGLVKRTMFYDAAIMRGTISKSPMTRAFIVIMYCSAKA